jgi:hypothetical protein
MKKIFKTLAVLVGCFAFVTAVFALSGSASGVTFYSIGDSKYLTSSGNMTLSYKSTINPTTIYGDNTMETEVQLPVLWYYNTYAFIYQSVTTTGPHTTYWDANTNNKTRFLWTKTGGSGYLVATLSYDDL